MRLVTYTTNGSSALGIEVNGRIANLAAAAQAAGQGSLPNDMRSFLEGGDAALQSALATAKFLAGDGATNDTNVYPAKDAIKITAPILNPRKIICIGLNYMDHVIEQNIKAPELPVMFAKFDNAIIGTGDAIIHPKETKQLDYEAELGFVVGKTAKNVKAENALDYVAGYTNINDVSARDLQFSASQWTAGKACDTFCPMGPYLVTKDEISDPHNLSIRTTVNDQVLQDSNSRHLIFKIPQLIEYITAIITLEPGDVVSTGTPDGVGVFRNPQVFLKAGDTCRIEIEKLGQLVNPVKDEE